VIQYDSCLLIKNETIQWKFPITGIVDALSSDQQYLLKTKARVLLKTSLTFSFPGI